MNLQPDNTQGVKVGDGATAIIGTDLRPYTIIAVILTNEQDKIKFLVVQADWYYPRSGSMLDGSAEYAIAPEPTNKDIRVLQWSPRRERWEDVVGKRPYGIGERRVYRDPHI